MDGFLSFFGLAVACLVVDVALVALVINYVP